MTLDQLKTQTNNQFNKVKHLKDDINEMIQSYQTTKDKSVEELIWGLNCKYGLDRSFKLIQKKGIYDDNLLSDLYNDSYLIFIDCLDKYDLTFGTKFSSYYVQALTYTLIGDYNGKYEFGIALPNNMAQLIKGVEDGTQVHWAAKSATNLHINSLESFINEDSSNSGSKIEKHLASTEATYTATTLDYTNATMSVIWGKEIRPLLQHQFKTSIKTKKGTYNERRIADNNNKIDIFEVYYGIGHEGDALNGVQISELFNVSKTRIYEHIKLIMENLMVILNKNPQLKQVLYEFLY